MIKLLIYGLIGYVVYTQFLAKKSSDESVLEDPMADTNVGLLTQPSQKYPFTKEYDPRMDNSDQPWYVDSRAFMGKADLTFFSDAGERDANVMSYNTNQFWQELTAKYH